MIAGSAAVLPREAPEQAREGEGNAELCQLLMGSGGSAALLALHSDLSPEC